MEFPTVMCLVAICFCMHGTVIAQDAGLITPSLLSESATVPISITTVLPDHRNSDSTDAPLPNFNTTVVQSAAETPADRTAKRVDDHVMITEQEPVREDVKKPLPEGKFDPARLLQLASKYGIARSAALPGFTLTPPRSKWSAMKNKTGGNAQPVFLHTLGSATAPSIVTTTRTPPTTASTTLESSTMEAITSSMTTFTTTTSSTAETEVTLGETPAPPTTMVTLLTEPSTLTSTTVATTTAIPTTPIYFPPERAFVVSDPNFIFVENVTFYPSVSTAASTPAVLPTTSDVAIETSSTTARWLIPNATTSSVEVVVPVEVMLNADDELAKATSTAIVLQTTAPSVETVNTTLAETNITALPDHAVTTASPTIAMVSEVETSTAKLLPDLSKFRPGMDCSESATCDAYIPNSYCQKMDGDFGICTCLPSLTPVNTTDLRHPCGERTVCTENPCRGDVDASACVPLPDRFLPDTFGRFTFQKSFECHCTEGSVGNAHSPTVAGLCCRAGRAMCKDGKSCYGFQDVCDGIPQCQDLTDEMFAFCGKRERTLALARSRTMEDATDPIFLTSLQAAPAVVSRPRAVLQSRADEGLLVGTPFGIPGMVRVPFRSTSWGVTY